MIDRGNCGLVGLARASGVWFVGERVVTPIKLSVAPTQLAMSGISAVSFEGQAIASNIRTTGPAIARQGMSLQLLYRVRC